MVRFSQQFTKGLKRIVKKYPAFAQDMESLLHSLEENAFQGVEPLLEMNKKDYCGTIGNSPSVKS